MAEARWQGTMANIQTNFSTQTAWSDNAFFAPVQNPSSSFSSYILGTQQVDYLSKVDFSAIMLDFPRTVNGLKTATPVQSSKCQAPFFILVQSPKMPGSFSIRAFSVWVGSKSTCSRNRVGWRGPRVSGLHSQNVSPNMHVIPKMSIYHCFMWYLLHKAKLLSKFHIKQE